MVKAKDVWSEMSFPRVFLKYKGPWDPDKFYQSIFDWYSKRKWDYSEPVMEHNRDKGFGKTDVTFIDGERKEDEWVLYKLRTMIWIFDEKPIEATLEGGGTKKLSVGRIMIQFQAHMEMDYEKKWNKSLLHAALKDIYNKYLMRRRITEKYWDKLWYELHQLNAHLKDVLNMQNREYEHKFFAGIRRG